MLAPGELQVSISDLLDLSRLDHVLLGTWETVHPTGLDRGSLKRSFWSPLLWQLQHAATPPANTSVSDDVINVTVGGVYIPN